MSWFKVDDKFHAHPKIKRIPRRLRRAAIGLWTLTGAWSADYQTDGMIPEYMLDDFDAETEEVDALVEVGLWERVDGGVQFCGWEEFQPTRAEQDAKRAATAERVRKYRQRRRGVQDQDVTREDGNAVTDAYVTPPYAPPEPEPEPEPVRTTTAGPTEAPALLEAPPRPSRANVYPDAFEVFWKQYPRKDDKRKALTAWKRATQDTPNEVLVAAATAYREDPHRSPQYTKLAASWLNAGAWENGPLPPRGGPSGGRPDAISQGLDTVARLRAQRLGSQGPQNHPQIDARRTA